MHSQDLIMDHNLSQVPKKSNTPDTEGHNGRTCQTGIVILDLVMVLYWQVIGAKEGQESINRGTIMTF
jgi:hypothetical protein